MKLCPDCDRHLFGPEPACPFCGAAQATVAAPGSDGALARLVLGLALGAAACGPGVGDGSGDDTSSGTGDPTTSTVTTGSTSTSAMSATTTADDGSETTTIADSSSSGGDADDGVASFYAGFPVDGGGPLECDVFAQDCRRDEKCNAWADDGTYVWNSWRCVSLDDTPDAPGDPCTVLGSAVSGFDSCAQGSMCFFVDPDTNTGTCVSQCTNSLADPMCPGEGELCVIANDDILALCMIPCDPLADECAEGQTCSPYADTFVCVDDPAPDGKE